MGCCQNRDENSKLALQRPKVRTRSLSVDLRLSAVTQESMVISTKGTPRESNESNDTNEKNLLHFVQTCSNKKKWEQLAPLISDDTPIQDSNVFISWTEKPKTVGCVALIHLGIAMKKFTTQVSPYVEVFLSVLLDFLKKGSLDLKENSIFLLYYYVDFATKKAMAKLLSQNIFLCLTKFMLSTKSQLRKFTVNLCYKLYKDREPAKKDFIKANGGFFLMQLVGWYGDNDFLEELLRNLKEMITQSGTAIEENINSTVNPLSLKILGNIDTSTRSIEIRSELEKIIQLYQSSG